MIGETRLFVAKWKRRHVCETAGCWKANAGFSPRLHKNQPVPHEDQPWVPQEEAPWVPHVVAGFSPRSFSDDLVAVLFEAQRTARPDTTSAPSFSKTAVGVLIFKLRPPPPRMTQSSAIMRSSM